MERGEILKTINDKFKEIADNDALELTETTQATDVEEWDSLTHIQLVVALEKHYKIRFTSREIQEWKNVGEVIDSVLSKTK